MRFKQPVLYLSNLPRCRAGWAPITPIPDAAEVRERRSLDLDEWVSFVLPAESDTVAQLVGRRVLGVVKASGTGAGAFDEYRIAEVERVNSGGERSVSVTARSLALDLADAGPLIYRETSGRASYSITATLTVAQWLSQYILPHLTAEGYSHFAAGDDDSTEAVSLSFEAWTPLQVCRELAARLALEFYVERNGTTNYLLHFVTRYVGAGRVARVVAGHQLLQHLKRSDTSQQATVLLPTGAEGPSERQQSIALLRYKVSAVDTVNDKLTLTHPDGTAGLPPIVADDEWNGLRIMRFPLGGTDVVLDSWGGTTQQVQIADVAISGWTVGDYVEVRHDDSTGTTYSVGATAGVNFMRATAFATPTITVKDMVTGGLTPLVAAVFLNKRVRGAPLQYTTTTATAVIPDLYNIAGNTSNIAVGDVGFYTTTGAEPYTANANFLPFRVTEIISSTQFRVEALFKYDPTPVKSATTGFNLRFYRPRATSALCTGGTTSTITILDPGGVVAANDAVLVEYPGGYGERIAIHDPASVSLYGRKVVQYVRNDGAGSINQMMHADPWFEVWSSGTVLTNWTTVSGTLTQVAAATVGGEYGAYVAQMVNGSIRSIHDTLFNPGKREAILYVRVRLRLPSGWTADTGASIVVSAFGASHVLHSPANTTPPAGASQTAISGDLTWVDFHAPIDLLGTSAITNYTLGVVQSRLTLQCFGAGGVLFDAVHVTTDTTPPATYDRYGSGYVLHAAGAAYLHLYKGTPSTYEITVADLARMDPTIHSADEIDIGTSLGVVDAVLDEFSTLRVVSAEVNHDNPADTTFTLNNVRETLTRLLTA